MASQVVNSSELSLNAPAWFHNCALISKHSKTQIWSSKPPLSVTTTKLSANPRWIKFEFKLFLLHTRRNVKKCVHVEKYKFRFTKHLLLITQNRWLSRTKRVCSTSVRNFGFVIKKIIFLLIWARRGNCVVRKTRVNYSFHSVWLSYRTFLCKVDSDDEKVTRKRLKW